VKPVWTVAHEYCDGCPGTYYYAPDDSWSFLDTILFSAARSEKATWNLRKDSVRLVNRHPSQRRRNGTPLRYDPVNGRGVSDHWPLMVAIESTVKQ
jgi:hypothetical protein